MKTAGTKRTEIILGESVPEVTYLENLKTLVKKRDYVGAYQYYQEYLREDTSLELKEYLDVLLAFVKEIQTKESEAIYTLYKDAFNRGDFDKARDYLNQYHNYIQQNSLNRNIDYHYSRINSRVLEVDTPSFVEKEQLYDLAKYCLNDKNYQGCIEAMNKYILLDRDLSAKGYVLRGRAYEFLKRYDFAKEDYQRALSIIPEPNAFYRLGRLCFFQKEYLDGKDNLLAYDERRPGRSFRTTDTLKEIYQLLGDKDNYERYKKLSDQLLEERKMVRKKKN